jgi:hypothetical protein
MTRQASITSRLASVALFVAAGALLVQLSANILPALDVRNWSWLDSMWWSLQDNLTSGDTLRVALFVVNVVVLIVLLRVRKHGRERLIPELYEPNKSDSSKGSKEGI